MSVAVFILHCVSRVETLDEKMREKTPYIVPYFVRSPKIFTIDDVII